jgi:hypothetical protein
MVDFNQFRFKERDGPDGVSSGNEKLADFIATGEFEDLEKLFWERSNWSQRYPFVHGRATFGAFADLHVESERAHGLIPAMTTLAETVPDPYFHMALALLERLIPKDKIGPRPPGFSDSLLRMRLRVEKLSFLPNLTSTWNSLMVTQRGLKSDDDPLAQYSFNELGIDRGDWPGLELPLQEFVTDPLAHCQVDFEVLRNAMEKLAESSSDPELIYSTRVKKTFYWVWQYPGKEGTAHLHRLIFLRQPVEGDCELGFWDLYEQFHERATRICISKRLREIEFSINDVVKVPRAPTPS